MSPLIILRPAIVAAIFGFVAPATCLCQPGIIRQPADQSVSLGADVTWTAIASGAAPLSYQWRRDDTDIAGAITRALTLTNVSLMDAGDYSLIVTDSSGSVTSRAASLEVDPTFSKINTGRVVTDRGASWGVSWGDYDNDGLLDLLVTNDGSHFLYRNAGNGEFTRITAGPLATDSGGGAGAAWGDYDNDGNLDLFASGYGRPHQVFRNDGNGSFTKLTRNDIGPLASAGGNGEAVSLGDYDSDGYLDLFFNNFTGVNELYRGSASGQFTKITTGPISRDGGSSLQGGWSDYDNDGDLDLLVVAHGTKFFYQNGGDGTFARLTASSIGDLLDRDGGHGFAWGDYDNDGDLDVFVSGHRDEANNVLNALYQNAGNGKFERMTPDQVGPIVTGLMGNGPAWADYDNDGFLDLFVTTRGNHTFTPDKVSSLYHSNGDGTFSQVLTGSLVNDAAMSWGAAWGDYDNDGFMDLAVANGGYSGSALNFLYRNNGNQNRWLKLKLEGTTSNRSGIGAKIRVKATIQGLVVSQMREIYGSDGYHSQVDSRPNFGLGDAAVAETVRIEWPSGIVQELTNVPGDQILTVVETARLNLDTPNRLSWHSSKAREFTLESASAVNGPWTPATEAVETDGNLRTAIIQADGGNRFYHLQNTPPAPIPPNPNPDTLVWMPAGTFLMGSPESEPEREPLVATTGYGDETLHQVTLTQGFWSSRYETLQPEYLALMGSNPSAFTGPYKQPVDSVNWHEAVAYCEALTAQEETAGRLPAGYVYRLPTEAEWEYACRAGTTTAFHLGDELRSRQANFDGSREYSVAEGGMVANPAGIAVPRPLPVGQAYYVPSAWGLSDMHGNVSEWCLDRMDHYPAGPVTDPFVSGPTEEQGAVVRGGKWGDPASACRSAARDYMTPSFRDSHQGFRVVLGRPIQ